MSRAMPRFDPDLAHDVAYEDLGPILLKWAWLTHVYLASLREPSRALFVSRSGLRMRLLYEEFLQSRGWASPLPLVDFWASRLLVTKMALHEASDEVLMFAADGYRRESLGEMVNGFMRHEPEWLDRVPQTAELEQPATGFAAAMRDPESPLGEVLRAYASFYRELYGSYFAEVIGDAGIVAFVDSGQAGSIHAMLQPEVPDTQLVSLLAAKMNRGNGFQAHLQDVVGVLFEGSVFDAQVPLTALVHHWHLLENLFETPGESISYLVDNDGRAEFPQAEPNLSPVDRTQEGDVHLAAVIDYVRDNGDKPPHKLLQDSVEAEQRLARRILYPESEDLAALMVPPRSVDFGNSFEVAVCIDPPSSTLSSGAVYQRHRRLEAALWKQCQLLLEYPKSVADDLMRIEAEGFDPYPDFDPREATAVVQNRPAVAVVTRTKDRPVLLARAAGSIAEQTYQNYLWVIVNDGRDPAPVLEVIEASAVPPDRITLLSNSRSIGMQAAANAGVGAVESKYVVVHDDDDTWDPTFLERTVEFLEDPRRQGYGGVISRSIYVSESLDGDQVIIHETRPYNDAVNDIHLAEMAASNIYPPISFLFRRSVWEEVGEYDEDLPVLGDWEFNLRVLMHSDIGVVPEPLAYYHHRDRGEASQYRNSGLSLSRRQLELGATIRNSLLRSGGAEAMAFSAALGYALDVLRSEIKSLSERQGPDSTHVSSGQFSTDAYWVALSEATRIGRGHFLTVERVAQLVDEADLSRVPIAPDFSEQEYLEENADVVEAVSSGAFVSGYHHYLSYGRQEGRRRPTTG